MDLSAEEIRVLGCLIEKQLTTPQQYPLTESALVTACNQTTNRDPVVSYDQSTVRRALLSLRQQDLARMVHRPGDRVEKHRHTADETLRLNAAEIAVLCVLMLRGPQTVGELRARSERLHAFGATSEVEAVLQMLADREPDPLVQRLEWGRGFRYRHLLGGSDAGEADIAAPAPQEPAALPPVAALQSEVAGLRLRVERLERQLGVEGASGAS